VNIRLVHVIWIFLLWEPPEGPIVEALGSTIEVNQKSFEQKSLCRAPTVVLSLEWVWMWCLNTWHDCILLLSRDKVLKFDWYTANFLMPLFELVEIARPFLLRPGNEASKIYRAISSNAILHNIFSTCTVCQLLSKWLHFQKPTQVGSEVPGNCLCNENRQTFCQLCRGVGKLCLCLYSSVFSHLEGTNIRECLHSIYRLISTPLSLLHKGSLNHAS